MPRSISRVALWCGLLSLAAEGCQQKQTWNLTPVEGTVTKGGSPLANIQVIFLADVEAGTQGPRTRGTTDDAGHYRLRTDGGDEGAVAGKYRVILHDLKAAKGRMGDTPGGPQLPEIGKRQEKQQKTTADESRVPPRYGNFNDTPLRVEVHPGPQTLDFDVP